MQKKIVEIKKIWEKPMINSTLLISETLGNRKKGSKDGQQGWKGRS
jgi:hypothetical protein